MKKLLLILLTILLFASPVEARWMKIFDQRLSNNTVSQSDFDRMTNFDLLIMRRNLYDDYTGGESTAWDYMKLTNADQVVLLYQLGGQTYSHWGCLSGEFNSTVGRWDTPDLGSAAGPDHSAGKIYDTNSHLYDLSGQPESELYNDPCAVGSGKYDEGDAEAYRMTVDYGRRGGEATTPTWPTYLDEATDTDIISQTWVADGIYLDNTSPCQKWSWPGYYSNDVIAESYCTGDADPWSCCQQETDCDDSSFTNVSWGLGVAWFLNEFKQDMAAQTPTQVLGANRTRVVYDDCSPGWKHLDDTIANKPAYVLDESITINVWGAEASTEYSWWNESQWRNAIQTISTIDNSTVLFQGQTECTATTCREEPGGATTWTVYDQFWFHLASAALVNAPGIKPTIMVGWDDSGTGYNATEVYSEDWWPEYEELEDGQNLDFGAAESPCDWATCDGGSGYGIDECTAADTPYDFCTAENAGTGWFSYLGVYWREFENGYIIVNPTSSAVNGFALPDDVCVQFAHAASGDVIKYDASIPYGDCPLDADSTLNMPAYTGTFIRKTSPPAQVADDASFGGGAIIGGGASLGGS